MTRDADVVVIGGGPGGYVCAIRAAQLGLKTVLVEGDQLGGICVAYGCIPSKALISMAKLYEKAKEGASFGIVADGIRVDLPALQKWKAGVVSTLETGVATLCRGNKVEVIKGNAEVIDARRVKVTTSSGAEEVVTKNLVIATGSQAISLPGLEFDGKLVLSSTEALALQKLPESMLVIGGGYIGLEIGSVYAALGSKVTVVEALDSILAMADRDLVSPLEKKLRAEFEAIYTSTKVAALEAKPEGIRVTFEGKDVPGELMFDRVLISVGRRPNFANLALEKAGVKQDEKGFIPVDKQRRTNISHIQAIGDIAGEPGLAHKATAEARVAVDVLLGEPAEWSPRAIPAVIFTDPEIAWAGLTQKDAEAQKLPHEVLKFPWAASGRAVSIARTEGLTKMLIDPESKRVLGVGIVGAGAGEMIAEGVLAVEMGAVARDVMESIHPHPTLSETVMESAELAYGGATHVGKPRKITK
ncbi:MAG: dihydrolipoyl dehydrogenase [Thaumarchaeota archaeon]|nr:dihydrolipoyl dehydrogenase [Nitrososphaerota archaeon]